PNSLILTPTISSPNTPNSNTTDPVCSSSSRRQRSSSMLQLQSKTQQQLSTVSAVLFSHQATRFRPCQWEIAPRSISRTEGSIDPIHVALSSFEIGQKSQKKDS
ncbi:hypothetical protein AABB24_039086, partial [Solanum stoloniferum]